MLRNSLPKVFPNPRQGFLFSVKHFAPSFLQPNRFSLDGMAQEDGGGFGEFLGGFGRQEAAGASGGELVRHFGMPLQVIFQALRHILALREERDACGHVFPDLVEQERIVRAAEDERVDARVFRKELVQVLLHEIIGAGRGVFVVLDERHPHRARLRLDVDMREHLRDFQWIGAGRDRAGRPDHADVLRAAEAVHQLDGRTDDAQDAPRGVPPREVALLDRAQRLGRSRVASQNDQLASLAEEAHDGLAREAIDHLKRTPAIRSPGIVSQIDIIIRRHPFENLVEHRQSAITRIEHANRPGCFREHFHPEKEKRGMSLAESFPSTHYSMKQILL